MDLARRAAPLAGRQVPSKPKHLAQICRGSIAAHLLIGQDSVAMRSLAWVEHVHLEHRPVPPKADRSQNSHPLQMSSREASCSGVAV